MFVHARMKRSMSTFGIGLDHVVTELTRTTTAVCATAARQSGWTGSPVNDSVEYAIRRRRGGVAIASSSDPSQRRRVVRGAEVGAVRRVDQRRRVAHAARQEPVDRHPGPALAGRWTVGKPGPCRLQPEQTARRRRDSHRATAVTAVGDRHDSSCDRSRRARRRSAGDVVEVPRIARRPDRTRAPRRSGRSRTPGWWFGRR